MCWSGFLILWLTFLPFALWDICGWASPLVEAVLAFLLMGVENIGASLTPNDFHVVFDWFIHQKQAVALQASQNGLS